MKETNKRLRQPQEEPEEAPEAEAEEEVDNFDEMPEDMRREEQQPAEESVFYEPERMPVPTKKELKLQRKAAKQEARKRIRAEKHKLKELNGQGARGSLRRILKFMLLVLGCYLVQVSIMPYLSIGGVTPNLMIVSLAVIIITSGMLRAYWAGAVYGILMATMLQAINYVTLLMYPVSVLFWSVFFADKSEKRLEADRAMNRPARNGNVYVRTVACGFCLTLTYEIVNLAYIYLGGVALTSQNLSRSGINLLLTTLLTAVLMVPFRRWLGFIHAPKEEDAPKGRYLNRQIKL